jgi:hypothetical protein
MLENMGCYKVLYRFPLPQLFLAHNLSQVISWVITFYPFLYLVLRFSLVKMTIPIAKKNTSFANAGTSRENNQSITQVNQAMIFLS